MTFDVVINRGEVTLDAPEGVTVENLTLNAPSSGFPNLRISTTLTVNGLCQFERGWFSGFGELRIAEGGTLDYDPNWQPGGAGTITTLPGSTFLLSRYGGTNFGGWRIRNGGIMIARASGQIHGNVEITSTGTFRSSVADRLDASFANNGLIDVQSGLLNLRSNTSTGTFNVASSGELRLEDYILGDGTEFIGPGKAALMGSMTAIAGKTTVKGTLDLKAAPLRGPGELHAASGGTIIWRGASLRDTGTISTAPGGTLRIPYGTASLASWTINNAGTMETADALLIYGTGTINNSGTLRHTGVWSINVPQIRVPLNNSGTIEVQKGYLSLTGGGVGSGTFIASDVNSQLSIDGNYTLTDGATFAGEGWCQLGSGKLSVAGQTKIAGRFALTGGELAEGGDLRVLRGGTVNWASTRMQGSGTITIDEGGTLYVFSNPHDLGQRTVNNAGLLYMRSPNELRGNGGALNNSGTVRIEGEWLYSTRGVIAIPLNNTGTVEALAQGISYIRGGGQATGIFHAAKGATLTFIDSYTLNDGVRFTGGGTSCLGESRNRGTLTLNGEATVAEGSFNLAYGTLSGNGTLRALSGGTINWAGSATLAGAGTIAIDPGGRMNVSGYGKDAGSWAIKNAGTADIDSDLGKADQMTVKFTVAQGGVANFGSTQHLAALNIDGGRAQLDSGGGKFLVTNALDITAGGVLDLADNLLIVQASEETRAAVLDSISSWIGSARNGSALWGGPGITSSTAQLNPQKGVAVGTAGNSVIARYTWNGDTDLNGIIDADDYFHIDQGFLRQLAGYGNGDFDYSGAVDADDYALIDAAFLSMSGLPEIQHLASPSVVPEPGTIWVLAAMGLTLAHRSRRRNHPIRSV